MYWKFPVDGLHNLRPCTGFLFPVNSCIYYCLYTVLFFTYKWTLHFQWSFLCTGILQSIYRIFPVDGLRISGSFKSCILPEFCSPSTGKTAPEKNRPYTVWTATLRSICWNFPVNLKQCMANRLHYFSLNTCSRCCECPLSSTQPHTTPFYPCF